MRRTRALLFGVLLVLIPPTPALAATPDVVATLDGRPLAVVDIPDYQCHDLEYPVIRCFRKGVDRDLSMSIDLGVAQLSLATSVVYVTVYDSPNFAGSSFSISQNYDALATVGWNDRVSSFRVRNSVTGRFYVDWFGGGGSWAFCCNYTYQTLGSYDNTFSSVYRS